MPVISQYVSGHMNPISADTARNAYRAANGEYAWRREDLSAALHSIAGRGLAVLGGEVWAIIDDQVLGLIPSAKDEPPGVWSWDTGPRGRQESWPAYCARTAEESIRTVAEMNVEREARPDLRNSLYFNVCFVNEDDL